MNVAFHRTSSLLREVSSALIFIVILSAKNNERTEIFHPEIETLGLRENGFIHAWIYFNDKGRDAHDMSASEISRQHLSIRAIQRRSKVMTVDVVTFRDFPVNEEYVKNIISTGALLRHRSRWLNAISIAATLEQLNLISHFSFVKKIDPVLRFTRPLPDEEETSPFPRSFRTSDRAMRDSLKYGSSWDQIRQINVNLAHEAGYTGNGILVLMLDTGYFKEHESIDPERIVAEWDFINGDGNTENEEEDPPGQHNHGTYTVSALGGYVPGTHIGPAYEAQFLLAKTEMLYEEVQQEEDNYVAALEWGENLGADVASSSIGYLDWYTYEDMDGNTAVTTKAVDIAVSLGMVCVTSAGNEANANWHYIFAPADADSVISVGAVNAEGKIASFSSRGPTYDNRIKPEVCARGVRTFCASASGPDQYTAVSGTSLSTPLVAGATAVILSAHPDWTPMMVREALLRTASQADSANNTYGWGIIDVWAAINYTSFIGPPDPLIPDKLFLAPNYPNPFNVSTTIKFGLSEESVVSLHIYDLLGREVVTLVEGPQSAGTHYVIWNPGAEATGVYFVNFRVPSLDFVETRKIIFLK